MIGTSIGAINGALIAGNTPSQRVPQLRAFWQGLGDASAGGKWATVLQGIPSFFRPRPTAWAVPLANIGLDAASYYSTEPLKRSLESLMDMKILAQANMRLTVGAVSVRSGALKYFDSRDAPLRTCEHRARMHAKLGPTHGRINMLSWTTVLRSLDCFPKCKAALSARPFLIRGVPPRVSDR